MKSTLLIAPLAGVLVLAGCVVPPGDASGGTNIHLAPPSCPFEDVVMVDGDSVTVGYVGELTVADHDVFAAAVGGSSFTPAGPKETIDDRILRWLDTCGTPDLVVVGGGINDLNNAVSPGVVIDEMARLDRELGTRGVDTVWVTIAPLAEPGGYAHLNPVRRQVNDWIRTPGNHSGGVADVVPALEDPARPDTLRQTYWRYWNDLFKPDGLHPNQAGYRAMAAVVAAAVDERLGS